MGNKTFKTELTTEEINFLINILDRTQLSGFQAQRFNLNLATKLSQLLEIKEEVLKEVGEKVKK